MASGAALALLACSGIARAATPIPEKPTSNDIPSFIGKRAHSKPVSRHAAPEPPRHPFMAHNDDSNIHDDAFQTDTADRPGPLGRKMSRVSTFRTADCATVAFDRKERVESVCVGILRPTLVLMDPETLDELASFQLPPRPPGGGNIFTDFSGGGYFYLDDEDRAVIVTYDRHLYIVAQTDGPGFELEHDFDLNSEVDSDDRLIAAMPDWSGRIWMVSRDGVVITLNPKNGQLRSVDLDEPIGNSFAVDDTGGVYIVTDAALYRFDAGRHGKPKVSWREEYENTGEVKPGQTEAGSGTTPTLMGKDWVAITDNADPMNVVVYRRRGKGGGDRRVCKISVFEKGASATDNSLIGTARSLVVENNFGYEGPQTTLGGSTVPGLQRIDVDGDGKGCRRVWWSDERAPTVVPKLSLHTGLVYTYTKEPDPDGDDPFYLTALDFRSGKTVFKQLAGRGLGFNNNYAPITIGPDGAAYVGVLGGLVALRDRKPPDYEKRPD